MLNSGIRNRDSIKRKSHADVKKKVRAKNHDRDEYHIRKHIRQNRYY